MSTDDNFSNNWAECQIDDVSDRIHYGYTATSRLDGLGVKYLRITDIQNGEVDWQTVPYCDISDDELEKFKLNENDLVFARTGGTVGKSYLLNKSVPEKAVFASYLIRIIINKNVSPKYISNFFQSLNYWSQIELGKTGLKTNVNAQILSRIKLNLAPLPEQRAIVAKIEQLFSALDHGIANLKAAKAKLDIYRQAVLKKAFEGELTREWRERNGITDLPMMVKIEDVIDNLTQGWSPKCLNEPSNNIAEWAVIKTSAIQHGQFIESENKVLPENLEPRSQHEIQKGDILITRAGPRVRVGVCCLVKATRPKLINCDKVYRIRLKKDVNNQFFEYRMTSLEFVHKIEEIKTGGNDSGVNLTQNRFLSLDFSLPPLEEQHQIVQEIESRLSVCDNILSNIDEGLEKAEALRQSILKKAFEGRLLTAGELAACRKEADWAPAGELLARMSA